MKNRTEKTIELVNKVPNGKELFKTNPTFNACIQAIVRGEDPVKLIGQVCQQMEDLRMSFEMHIVNSPTPQRIVT